MTWNVPEAWATDELVTATKMNQQIKDNVEYLKKRPLKYSNSDTTGGNTTSTSYAYVGNGLTVTFTPEGTTGNKCLYLIGFGGHLYASSATTIFNIAVEVGGIVDGDRLRVNQRVSAASAVTSFSWSNIRGLDVGTSYQLRLMWKTDNVSNTLTAQNNWHLWALEVSEALIP